MNKKMLFLVLVLSLTIVFASLVYAAPQCCNDPDIRYLSKTGQKMTNWFQHSFYCSSHHKTENCSFSITAYEYNTICENCGNRSVGWLNGPQNHTNGCCPSNPIE